MEDATRKALEGGGWRFGDAEDFLELTEPERRFVDLRAKLAAAVRRLRHDKGLTQTQAARATGTSQARMVDIEAAVSSLDLMFRAYFALGGELARLDELGAPLSAEQRFDRVTRPRGKSSPKRASADAPADVVHTKPPRRAAGQKARGQT